MKIFRYTPSFNVEGKYYPNRWDIIAGALVFTLILLVTWGSKQMASPYMLGDPLQISIAVEELPHYALRTVMRIALALVLSLLFTFTVGTLAAKSRAAERLIIPLIDVLQSVPILGFLPVIFPLFISVFKGSLLGPECAAIILIFTSQVWNMVLGFYQTLRSVPEELKEATNVLGLNAWQRFWRLEVPYSMPGLLWNTMLSLSASWFYVVAAEAISISNQQVHLPGVGSYIQLAIDTRNVEAIFYAILTMFLVILIYDQLIFRPLVDWANKFKLDTSPSEYVQKPWITRLLQRAHLLRLGSYLFGGFKDAWINQGHGRLQQAPPATSAFKQRSLLIFYYSWQLFAYGAIIMGIYLLFQFILATLTVYDILHTVHLGLYTAIRVFILIVIASLIWVPIGVWIGVSPTITRIAQPIAQFLAAFPANLFYPIAVLGIVNHELSPVIWLTPLMILGTQWYILFNVIAGTSNLPKELHQAVKTLGVRRGLWWRRFILPGIFPYYITGAMTAAGGAWNASIIVEYISWGDTTLNATGLGAYIAENTASGDFPRVALGVSIMCCYVLLVNRVVWLPLYHLAERRYQFEL